jgi:hypothetical protein
MTDTMTIPETRQAFLAAFLPDYPVAWVVPATSATEATL